MTMSREVVQTLACLLVTLVQAQHIMQPVWGPCPNLYVKPNFDLNSYSGEWFLQDGFNLDIVSPGGLLCSDSRYWRQSYDNILNVLETSVNRRTRQKDTPLQGTLRIYDPYSRDGKLTFSFQDPYGRPTSRPYWVLDTDYSSYSVVYTCKNVQTSFHIFAVWLLSRQAEFNSKAEQHYFYDRVRPTVRMLNLTLEIFDEATPAYCQYAQPGSRH